MKRKCKWHSISEGRKKGEKSSSDIWKGLFKFINQNAVVSCQVLIHKRIDRWI
jgi:hypothetical protein